MSSDDEKNQAEERRITYRVRNYWEQLCRGRAMPEEQDIDPDALGNDWSNCFLLQTRDIDKIEPFNFTYLGENIMAAYHAAHINPNNLFLIGPNAYCLAPHFTDVMKKARPLIDHSDFIADSGAKILYRQCLLPLGSEGRVTAIFGAMLFKLT